jgi:mRNA interferase YafQ
MRRIVTTRRFDKDFHRIRKRGYDLSKLQAIVDRIAKNGSPAFQYRPHKLTGNWAHHWECHIRPDWLLIYLITDDELRLVATGTHRSI